MKETIKTYHVKDSESERIRSLRDQIVQEKGDYLDEINFLEDAPIAAHKLPESLHRLFEEFKNNEEAGALHITGLKSATNWLGRRLRRIGAGATGALAPARSLTA